MKYVTNIDFNTPSNWINYEIFCNKEICESKNFIYAMWRTRQILDARYEKADLHNITSEKTHLTEEERVALHTQLSKYRFLFFGPVCPWKTIHLDIELQPDSKP